MVPGDHFSSYELCVVASDSFGGVYSCSGGGGNFFNCFSLCYYNYFMSAQIKIRKK